MSTWPNRGPPAAPARGWNNESPNSQEKSGHAGSVLVDGMLYVNSGYGVFGGAPGNVLLAFSVDGK